MSVQDHCMVLWATHTQPTGCLRARAVSGLPLMQSAFPHWSLDHCAVLVPGSCADQAPVSYTHLRAHETSAHL
eukprot:2901392-Alexandrium_andersonii.AAC.1